MTAKIEITEEQAMNKDFGPISDYEKMLQDEFFADFKLKCNDGEILKAHKSILAARSPVFFAMLTNNMQEAQQGFADIPDFDSKTMKEVLRFIYRNNVEELKEKATKLIFAAEKYELEELKQMCVASMIASLTTENVLQKLLIADRVSQGKKLSEKCIYLVLW